jgi:glycerophosphoryl diester phosphodiesterase
MPPAKLQKLLPEMNKKFMLPTFSVIVILFLTTLISHARADNIKVAAYRGASGQLPENSLSAFVLAAALKSDFISMDLVMTRDDHLVVYRDIDITDTSNVAVLFPERERQDGRYYVIDFTLAELQQLNLTLEKDARLNSSRIPAFTDVLFLLRKMEKVFGYTIGIAPEIKKPWFHLNEGKDISKAVMDELQRFHYTESGTSVFLQCYDPDELQRIHKKLLVPRAINLRLVQLIDTNDGNETQRLVRGKWVPYNFEWLYTRTGAKLLALYADAVGMSTTRLLTIADDSLYADFLSNIGEENIKIHALFLGNNTKVNAVNFNSYADLLNRLLDQVNVDMIVTDLPAETLTFLKSREVDTDNEITGQKLPLLYTPTPLKE